jgi:hypothetical protein
MEQVELFPSLSHCIETAARDEFWNSANQYMEGGRQDKRLEHKIELLKVFLESADFKRLCSDSERHLLEGKKVRFIIWQNKDGLNCEMVVTEG